MSIVEGRRVPTRWDAVVFGAKVWGLRAQRGLQDFRGGLRRWPVSDGGETDWHDARVVSTLLWTVTDAREREMERGKVENLRRAAALLDGVVVDAGGVFSFWRQMGRASAARGFVVGRMLKQGCVVPAVGGGLCQLTNALYEAALMSGCEIVERHGHSMQLVGMPVHDATVAWNYVDLRVRARQRMRLKIEVGDAELSVGVQFLEPMKQMPMLLEVVQSKRPAVHVGSCVSCGEVECFRHQAEARK